MRFKLIRDNCTEAYHYGDLDKAIKADKRSIMAGRGTGHFGTGFYLLGRYKPEDAREYAKRGHWEIDLSSYNMYEPKSNDDGYKLHDDLKAINDLAFRLRPYITITKSRNDLERELDDLEYEKDNDGIIEFIERYEPNYLSWYPINDAIKDGRWGEVEDYAKEIIGDIESAQDKLEYVSTALAQRFNRSSDEIRRRIITAVDSDDNEDSPSTLFMKGLGYEGVDVTRLDHDADGLSGLDNLKYGSVVYDLKPGTYKKLK